MICACNFRSLFYDWSVVCKACACALATCLIVTWRTSGINFVSIMLCHMLQRLLRRVSIGKRPLRVPKTLTLKIRLGAQPFLWKWVFFAWEWKMISISKAEHLPSLWNRGPWELGNGLFNTVFYAFIIYIVAGFFLLADCWKLLFSKVSILILESNSLFSY